MAWSRWSLWNFALSRLAKAQGYLDPIAVFSQLQRFAKPSEVWVPSELLRSGAILQARGLVNSQAIQHNLDWVWPFWVGRQFNPKDVGFIPRAFSMTHINLTHRNWTALGLPDYAEYPIVDPRGLLTPFFDSWSIDAWIVSENATLIPSQLDDVLQVIHYDNALMISTVSKANELVLEVNSQVGIEKGVVTCESVMRATSPFKVWLAVCVRPYNPEGVSFIHAAKRLKNAEGWNINGKHDVHLSAQPMRYLFSNYHSGDILDHIRSFISSNNVIEKETESISCNVGMASMTALYELNPNQSKDIVVKIPLSKDPIPVPTVWSIHLKDHCQLQIPDKKFQFLYDVALRTLILHSPGDVYPGPYTYKRFWFRDAAFILSAMLVSGLSRNIEKIIDRFTSRQTALGYFKSQDGEWDSNGQALWIMERFSRLRNKPLKKEWVASIAKGAKWIQRKRLSQKEEHGLHAGLLPAGFSAEHFGPSDFYYWDDFWGVAGLKAAASLMNKENPQLAQEWKEEAKDFMTSIELSLESVKKRLNNDIVPASSSRRVDCGAIGSLTASYPLQLWSDHDPRMVKTAEIMKKNFFLHGGFYHEISHSGINAYLTLHVAQVLLRAGDPSFFNIVSAVADLASPTGQWPEAIHPRTKGGCMGDGQHVWAAAEWVVMIRNMFVREEEDSGTLILCSGIPSAWLKEGETLSLGPTSTPFGKISVLIKVKGDINVSWEAQWYGKPPVIEVQFLGQSKQTIKDNQNSITLKLDK